MVPIPRKVSSRLLGKVGPFQRILEKASNRDVNESDTVTIVTDMLASLFGFDKYSEITSEQAIRGTYCDLAIRINGSIRYLIEVKAIGINLKENHLRQAINYGAAEGIPWVVLTNGIEWEIHRIKFERPVRSDSICSFNFLDLNPRKAEDQATLFLLCKEGLSKAAIEKYHEHVQSVNRFVIGALMLKDPVLNVVRRELRKLFPGLKVSTDEIQKIVEHEVLKREIVEGESATKAKKKIKKVGSAARRGAKKVKAVKNEPKLPRTDTERSTLTEGQE